MRVFHDRATFDFSILLEKTGDLALGETRMDASDEEVGTRVTSRVVTTVSAVTVSRGWAAGRC